jgi:hypothetical protein
MTRKDINKLYLPIGLLSVCCALGLGHFMLISDFLNGFLIGFGLTCLIAGLIKERNSRK